MLKDLKRKGLLKHYLIVANIAIGVVLLTLLLYWLASVRPGQILQATRMGQYMYYTIDNLPTAEDRVQADYVGPSSAVISKKSTAKDDSDIESNSIDIAQDIDELVEKTNKLLAPQEKILQKNSAKRIFKGQPKIALIITNLGLNRRSTELALTLPKQCALGFLPYTKSLKPLLHKAQGIGHEIYLYVPLQTDKALDNPGKYALMTNLAPEENAMRLNIILNSHARYDGVYSSYKEIFTDNQQLSEILFDHLNDKNLIFIIGKTYSQSSPKYYSRHDNVIQSRVIIDEEPDKEAISKQLSELIKLAKQDGMALGYAQGFTLTIEIVRDWVKKLQDHGITLVPVSELLKEYNS